MAVSEVSQLIDQIASDRVRADASATLDLIEEVTGEAPEIWPTDTIGFGRYHYRYASGQEGDFFKVGFTPRHNGITLYVMSGLRGFGDLLGRLGPHTAGKSTVKFSRLSDLDLGALRELVGECVRHLDQVESTLGAIPRMSEIPPRQA